MTIPIRRVLQEWAHWKRRAPNGYPSATPLARAHLPGASSPSASRIPKGVTNPPKWVIEINTAMERLTTRSPPALREALACVRAIYLQRRPRETLDALAARLNVSARTLRQQRTLAESMLSVWLIRSD